MEMNDRPDGIKVMSLLKELEDIVDTSSGLPLTDKIMVDSKDILEITKEIRESLPDDIQQAMWIKSERERILGEAKIEYETIIRNAEEQAEEKIDNSEILNEARDRANYLRRTSEDDMRMLKLSTYDYVDKILFEFQEKMDDLSKIYFEKMFKQLEAAFDEVNATLVQNRDEVREMAYRASMNKEGELERRAGKYEDMRPAYEEDYEEEEY